jgi:hypothetical protein
VIDDTHSEGIRSMGDFLVCAASVSVLQRHCHCIEQVCAYSPNSTYPNGAKNLLVGITARGKVASPIAGSNTSEGLVCLSQSSDHEEDGNVSRSMVECSSVLVILISWKYC